MINVGIVGYGYAGRYFHSYLINLAEGLNLSAVVSRSPERRAQAQNDHPGIKTYETLDMLIENQDIQMVVIATPHSTHRDLSIKSMNAKKHVVTDKVMCMNGREATEMIESARRNKVVLSVFQNRRWDWDFLTVKDVINKGIIGSPYRIETGIFSYSKNPGGWRGMKEMSGGILYDWGAHLVDQGMILGNYKIESVYCEVQYVEEIKGSDIGNFGRLVMKFKSGLVYEIQISNRAVYQKPRWLVFSENGVLYKYGLDPQEKYMIAGDIDAAYEPEENYPRIKKSVNGKFEEMVLTPVKGTWKSYYNNISDVLNEGDELIVKPEECRKCMYVFDAAMRSAKTNSVVKL
jgi:scyllo-inositol 2-dehydrogenase (NADP+)